MSHPLIHEIEKAYMKTTIPDFQIGDTVDVLTRIVEGEKERNQVYSGIVIARRGRGGTEMFTVRRTVGNEGVERTFMLHSPRVVEITVKRRGKARRAKLYYLRYRVGKARKLRELRVHRTKGIAAPEETTDRPANPRKPEPVAV